MRSTVTVGTCSCQVSQGNVQERLHLLNINFLHERKMHVVSSGRFRQLVI